MSSSLLRFQRLTSHAISCSAPCRPLVCRGLSSSSSSSSSCSSSPSPILTSSSLNPRVVSAQYAVRGELVIRADSIRDDMAKGTKYPFNHIVACNIGNPQELKQQPITFFRQVLALCHYPALITDPNASKAFAPDAIARAKLYLSHIAGTGAYTTSQGIKIVRDQVAAFIASRDGYPSDPDNIFITDGASAAVKMVLNTVIREGANDGVMVPIPQYPLYTASLALYGGQAVKYYLEEKKTWALQRSELERSLAEARKAGITTRALVVINPGNPTGQCLEVNNMKEIIEFCHQHRIVLCADEVYQTNIYSSIPFTSFKKVVSSMGPTYSNFELISFHSVSKGFLGECGQRGGYMELHNIDPAVKSQLYKLASISLCSNTSGQLMTGLMCAPPKPGDASYNTYAQERDSIIESLKRRAIRVAKALNELEGVSCQPVQGAMYAFPSITLPARAIAAAASQNKAPDAFYALALLDATGVCVVPGSGFGQREGTYHFRTTILPSESTLDDVLDRMRVFHAAFLKKYA